MYLKKQQSINYMEKVNCFKNFNLAILIYVCGIQGCGAFPSWIFWCNGFYFVCFLYLTYWLYQGPQDNKESTTNCFVISFLYKILTLRVKKERTTVFFSKFEAIFFFNFITNIFFNDLNVTFHDLFLRKCI